ncbi:MAG: glycosyltransferase family 2 protein [Bacteroidetes bacterium]|nr:MAG: glycosyltransferase family 2 protein [Bacteroidota bacterium]
MSSLSNLPYSKILAYWYKKLSGKPYRYKFLLTKTVEVFTFKSHSGNSSKKQSYFDFPAPKKNSVPDNPKLSIVIPIFIKSYKDKKDLSNLLQSIEKQSMKPREVIVIDDCSPINVIFPETIKVCRLEQNSGPAKARNIGKNIAIENGSDIIAFTDTDCILSEHWISTIIQSFLDYKDFQIISGDTPAYDQSWFGTYHNINGTLNGRQLKNSERLLYGTTANLAITREVAENIDFNENFPIAAGEDIEFCFKANKQGFAIKYIPTMTVFHNFGYNGQLIKDLKLFRQQFKKYGNGEKILLKIIPNYYAYFDKTEEIPTKKNGI